MFFLQKKHEPKKKSFFPISMHGKARITPNWASTVCPQKNQQLSVVTELTAGYTGMNRLVTKKVNVDSNFLRELPGTAW